MLKGGFENTLSCILNPPNQLSCVEHEMKRSILLSSNVEIKQIR